MVDPLSGVEIPKRLDENIAWRQHHLLRADKDPEHRQMLWALCARSPILATNLLYWTETEKDILPDGRAVNTDYHERPFITRPIQDYLLYVLFKAEFESFNISLLKSRDEGASWITAAKGVWGLHFVNRGKYMFGSRKAEEVYRLNDPDTLFWKLDYNARHQGIPKWVAEGIEMKEMLLTHDRMGSSIVGESQNSDFGRGGRARQVFKDEAAAMDHLQDIDDVLDDTCNSQVDIFTPKAGSWANQKVIDQRYFVVKMPWHDNPHKGQDRRPDPATPTGWASSWYDVERYGDGLAKRPRSKRSLAENVDMHLGMAGDMLLDVQMVENHRIANVRMPKMRGEIVFARSLMLEDHATTRPEQLAEGDEVLRQRALDHVEMLEEPVKCDWPEEYEWGSWRLWCDLAMCRATGRMRPSQDTVYVLSADPGGGRGRNPGTIDVFDAGKREQVASWSSAAYGPKDQARIMVAAAIWFGGVREPLLIWETNGIGGSYGEMVVHHLGWPHVFERLVEGQRNRKPTKKYGWHNTGGMSGEKRKLVETFGDALNYDAGAGGVVIRDGDTLDEAKTWIIYDDGNIGPARTASRKRHDREEHGDKVMSAALGVLGMSEIPDYRVDLHAEARRNPNTIAGRQWREERERELAEANVYDWRDW